MKLGINQVHCTAELPCINEIAAISHPERITRHGTADIDDCASHCNLNLFYLIEDKQSKFLVETIEHHHLAERSVRFIAMLILWHL